jgi:hypothetical protein
VVNLQSGWLACMALALALSAVAPAWAQAQPPEEELRIQHLRLQVLAEYDDARVLVIGQGRLAGGLETARRKSVCGSRGRPGQPDQRDDVGLRASWRRSLTRCSPIRSDQAGPC